VLKRTEFTAEQLEPIVATPEPESPSSCSVLDDPRVLDAVRTVERATGFGVPVLIRGETGTGKELLARHVHGVSGRGGEFVGVNCAAVPEGLIEAELFGYERGAFTGASSGGAMGLVRQADGGTLFLDEIGDMPYELQGRLLRLLDAWRVRPVGGKREYEVDVQLVAATNCDLEQAVTEGRFRLDLLHRIKVVEVRLPALRERADFDEIVAALLAEIEPAAARLSEGALARLRERRWEGNMRELRNVLTRLLIRAGGGEITEAVVEEELSPEEALGGLSGAEREYGRVEDAELEAVYRRCRGNVAATARQLGISRTTVYNRLRGLRAG